MREREKCVNEERDYSQMMENDARVLVVGAGIAGLSLAYHLEIPYKLIERDDEIGGICRSIVISECTFDYGPRILLPGSQYTAEVSQKLLGDNLHNLSFNDWIYHHSYHVYTKYPVQKYLYGLPADDILSCLTGLVDATINFDQQSRWNFANYRDWLYYKVGRPMADMVVIPQETKKWRTDPAEMDYRWAPRKVVRPDLETALRGATHDLPHDREFGYPRRGGIAALMQAMADQVTDVTTRIALQAINTHNHTARFSDGCVLPYRALVATLPLPELIAMLDNVPRDVQDAAYQLMHISLLCVCLVVAREHISDKNFVYVYDPDLIFQRVSFFSNLSPEMAPPGYSSLVAEVSYKGTPPMDDDMLVHRVCEDLHAMQVLEPDDRIEEVRILRMPYAYPRMHIGYLESVQEIRNYLETHDIYTLGRFGEWEYLNIHDIIPRSKVLADQLHTRYG